MASQNAAAQALAGKIAGWHSEIDRLEAEARARALGSADVGAELARIEALRQRVDAAQRHLAQLTRTGDLERVPANIIDLFDEIADAFSSERKSRSSR